MRTGSYLTVTMIRGAETGERIQRQCPPLRNMGGANMLFASPLKTSGLPTPTQKMELFYLWPKNVPIFCNLNFFLIIISREPKQIIH